MRDDEAPCLMDVLLSEAETAQMLGVAHRTLQWWRKIGASPPYTRISSSLRSGDTSDKAFSVTFGEKGVHGAYVPTTGVTYVESLPVARRLSPSLFFTAHWTESGHRRR